MPSRMITSATPRVRRMLALTSLFFLSASVLSGCATYPKAISLDDPENQPTFNQLKKETAEFADQEVVLGGHIVSVKNTEQGSTIEVLQMPLFDSGRPKGVKKASQGRFLVDFKDELLDPEVYAQGEAISVRGLVRGRQPGKIGDAPYTYLILEGTGLYLWPEKKKRDVHYVIGAGYSPFYRPAYPYRYSPAPVYVVPAGSSKAKSSTAPSDGEATKRK